MAIWRLTFNHPSFVTLDAFEGMAAKIAGGKIAVTLGELEGNPRDYYGRSVEVTGEREGMQLRCSTTQYMLVPDDPEPHITGVYVTIASEAAPFAAKLALWERVQEVLSPLGFTEHTLTNGGSEIIDEAETAGDAVTAERIRAAKAGALVAQAPRTAHVSLVSPRTDIEPILAAYQRPEDMASLALRDCGLTALPKHFFRFPKLKDLSLEEDAFDGDVLRGVSLPKLERLTMRGASLRSLTKEDLAGFPALEVLSCASSPLEHLDPEIVVVCPRLIRVYVDGTPLSKNEPAMAALRARWPRMLWRYHDGHATPAPPVAAVPVTAKKAPPGLAKKEAPPELRPFFDAILAAPDDDAPRLELAKHLTARGDKRGEHIRLACELAKLEPDDPAYASLRDALQRHPEFVFFSDTYYPFLGLYSRRRRGFIEHIACSGLDFVAYADVLLRDAPIRGLTLSTVGVAETVAGCRQLAQLRELRFGGAMPEERATVLASPHLQRTLRRAGMPNLLDDAAAVKGLAAELRPLEQLTELVLDGRLSAAAVPALVELVRSRHLQRLAVDFCTMKPTRVIEDLWEQLGEVVRPRRVLHVPFEGGVLDLADAKYSLEQIRALVATGSYRSATTLKLSCARNGQGVVTFLATCGAFPELVELVLGWASDVGVQALATKAVGLDRLAEIFLGEITSDRPGVTDAGVETLARSPRLPALRTIERSQTHNVYAPDAREDDERIEIKRDDGTVVESIIGHSLWP